MMSDVQSVKALIIRLKEECTSRHWAQFFAIDLNLRAELEALSQRSLSQDELYTLRQLQVVYNKIYSFCAKELEILEHKMAMHRDNREGVMAYEAMQQY